LKIFLKKLVSRIMQVIELFLLGAIAGFTILLGLPIARMKAVSPRVKGMLNAAAIGILIFLLVEVMGEAFEATAKNTLGAFSGKIPMESAVFYLALLIGGIAIGLLSLVWFEQKFVKKEFDKKSSQIAALTEEKAKRIALMIAIGIGLHNFSEGLAIGQSYASGAISLALLLVVGFGLHNATEGFGIAAPLSGFAPRWRFIALLGLIGGGPTFVGTIVGSIFVSVELSVFFFALAGGAIIYVIKELFYHGRTHADDIFVMSFIVLGVFIGFATDLAIKIAGG